MLLLTSGLAAAGVAPVPDPGARYAIVVGVERYTDDDIRDLRYAEDDAREMARYLHDVARFDRVWELSTAYRADLPDDDRTWVKARADREVVEVLLDRLTSDALDPYDTLVVYFSGHGVGGPDELFGGETVKQNYLLPPRAQVDNHRLSIATAISLRSLTNRVAAAPAAHRLVIADACRNDPYTTKGAGDAGTVDETLARSVIVLLSTRFGLPAYEDPEAGLSAFTAALLEGLEGPADTDRDGFVATVTEAFPYVRRILAEQRLRGRAQEPRLSTEDWDGVDLRLPTPNGPALPPVTPPQNASPPDVVRVEALGELLRQGRLSDAEAAYADLVAEKGEATPGDVLLLGAAIAQARGDAAARYDRLRAAARVRPTAEVWDALEHLDRSYAPVELLGATGMALAAQSVDPLDEDGARALRFAQAQLDATHAFTGLLPVGAYTFGGNEFQVVPGVSHRIELSPRRAPTRLAVGPVARLGVAARAGTLTSYSSDDASFAGVGSDVRLGLGLLAGRAAGASLTLGVGLHPTPPPAGSLEGAEAGSNVAVDARGTFDLQLGAVGLHPGVGVGLQWITACDTDCARIGPVVAGVVQLGAHVGLFSPGSLSLGPELAVEGWFGEELSAGVVLGLRLGPGAGDREGAH